MHGSVYVYAHVCVCMCVCVDVCLHVCGCEVCVCVDVWSRQQLLPVGRRAGELGDTPEGGMPLCTFLIHEGNTVLLVYYKFKLFKEK